MISTDLVSDKQKKYGVEGMQTGLKFDFCQCVFIPNLFLELDFNLSAPLLWFDEVILSNKGGTKQPDSNVCKYRLKRKRGFLLFGLFRRTLSERGGRTS